MPDFLQSGCYCLFSDLLFTTAPVHIQMPALFFASLFGSLILLYPFKSIWKKAGSLLFHIK